MELLLEKELTHRSYNCGECGKKIYVLSNTDGVDIYQVKDNKLLASFVKFQSIIDLFLSYDERYLIALCASKETHCFDLETKKHISTFAYFCSKNEEIISLTTSLDKNELIIISSKSTLENSSHLLRLSIPTFNFISSVVLSDKFIHIRKNNIFNHYYLISKNDKIKCFDANYNFIDNISLNSEQIGIKNCIALDNPKRLLVQDLRKVFILNSKYELFDEFSLTNNDQFIKKYQSPNDILKLNTNEDIDIILNSEIIYSSGLFKNRFLVYISNNILLNNQCLKIFDLSLSKEILKLKTMTTIKTVLLLPEKIIISGNEGTYLFSEKEKSELIIFNPLINSLSTIHKKRLIDSNNTT